MIGKQHSFIEYHQWMGYMLPHKQWRGTSSISANVGAPQGKLKKSRYKAGV